MIRPEEVIRVGKLLKPHGVKGELSMLCENDCFDRVDGEYLVCDMDGILVPFFIDSYRFKSDTALLIKFEDVDTVEQAERMAGVNVYFPKALAGEEGQEAIPDEFLAGYSVSDSHLGLIGEIDHVDNSTINTLLVIKRGDGEILIPFHEEFIRDVDEQRHLIIMELPEGLVQLNCDKTINNE